MKYTKDLIKSFLLCRYKTYLYSKGKLGEISEYEQIMILKKQAISEAVYEKINANYSNESNLPFCLIQNILVELLWN